MFSCDILIFELADSFEKKVTMNICQIEVGLIAIHTV